ncbi:MAG: hypothetical protein JWN79_3454 [Gemmatimonadetes bacterium]|nr:hypothetical protein [Gemmatimonadota bacterium]
MSLKFRRFGALALGLIFAAGCAQDRATAPAPAAATTVSATGTGSGDLLGTLGSTVGNVTSVLGLTKATGLQRTTPLAEDITVVKSIGVQGGILSIPEAGVTVIVPYGALDRTVEITMTARKGSLVAYDFAPHGITFARPLVFNQQLGGTNTGLLGPLGLKLGYYADPSLLGGTTALVSELVGGVTSVLTRTFTAPIKHFSGYVVTCGRGDSAQ